MEIQDDGQHNTPDLIRVNDEDLDEDGDMQIYQGQPFTGMGYEEYADGALASESLYKEGWPNGYTRIWYPNGQIKDESDWERGKAFSVTLTWYPDGKLHSKTHSEWGIVFDAKAWDEDGNLIKNIERAYDDPLRVTLRKRNTQK